MPLQATSGAASYDAFGGGVPVVPNYIEDVFSTWLYTGNGSTQTITNGIDLAGKGGLVWYKRRDAPDTNNLLFDTVRGASNYISSNTTFGQASSSAVSAFNSDGFNSAAASGGTIASWTFRKQPKFFDVVTWTGDSNNSRMVSHNLGSVPGCIIAKRTDSTSNWFVWHIASGITTSVTGFQLNGTAAATTTGYDVSTDITSTQFRPAAIFDSSSNDPNASGATYVAHLFAHNAGGFGLTGTDNVISCGSFTCPGSGGVDVNLGYEPQWILTKKISGAENWNTWDTMRGWALTNQAFLAPNNANAEVSFSGTDYFYPTATGFRLNSSFGLIGDYIYIAIRRGPMKVPTDGTKVFLPIKLPINTAGTVIQSGFPTDLLIGSHNTNNSDSKYFTDRLRGNGNSRLDSTSTAAESASSGISFAYSNGALNGETNAQPAWYFFRRAPGFFDEVCYTGTFPTVNTQTHNLGAAPELMIVKNRSGTFQWAVYSLAWLNSLGLRNRFGVLNTTASLFATDSDIWNNTLATSTSFQVNATATNANGSNFVAYLFATCPGVSKCGLYTGTGSTQTIDCGFTGGARFVLIKAASTTGNWLVWDSARGIVSGDDPYLALNSTAAEVTNTDWVDTAASGFELSNAGGNLANSSGVSYIFLAIS